MNEQQGQRHARALPQYSSDGRWWWDGHQWALVSHQYADREARPAVPPAPPTLAAAKWALTLGVASVVGSLFWWVFLFLLMPLILYSSLLFPNNGMLASAAAVVFLLVLVLVTGVLAVVVGI